MDSCSNKKRVFDDSDESELTPPDVKRLREDLLNVLDDSDLCMTSQDLESFMKSFEDEISHFSPPTVKVMDSATSSSDSRPELGYLLEASDDELGLPPSISSLQREVETELVRVASDSLELSELWRFEEEITGYDSFDLGFGKAGCHNNGNSNNAEYVAIDGLFDYSDVGFVGSSDISWQPKTLPAQ